MFATQIAVSSIRAGRYGSAVPAAGGHANSPVPVGAASMTLNWDIPSVAADGNPHPSPIAWQKILLATVDPIPGVAIGTQFPFWYYIEDNTTTQLILSGVAAGAYFYSAVFAYNDTAVSLPEAVKPVTAA